MVDRAMNLVTPTGQSASVVELHCQEDLGTLFQADVEIAVSGNQPLALGSWVGQKVVVSVSLAGQSRYVSGICSRISEGAAASPTTYHDGIVFQPSAAGAFSTSALLVIGRCVTASVADISGGTSEAKTGP